MMTNPPYIVRKSTSKAEWLKNREGVLTATQVARLITGTPSEKRDVYNEFHGKHSDFDNRYMRWGREREPVLAEMSMSTDSSLRPNDQFLVYKDDERLGATPDLLGERGDIIGEIKTSNQRAPRLVDNHLDSLQDQRKVDRYWWQVQVQLLVTGAEVCLFMWEEHDNVWIPDGDGVERPKPYEVVRHLIYPEKWAFDTIWETVDDFFENGVEDIPDRAVEVMGELKKLHQEMEYLKWHEDDLRDELKELLPVGGSWEHGEVQVSHYQPKPRKRFDTKRFKSTYVDLYDKFVTEQKSKPTLRIQFKED